MSNKALTWCRTVRVPLVQKVVLYCLSDRADEHGAAWPSIATIVAETCASERAVQNALRALADAHMIRVDRSLRKTPTYFLQIRAPAGDAPRTSCAPQHVHPAGDAPNPRSTCTPPPQEMHPTPAGDAPKASLKHQVSQIEASTRTPAPGDDLFGDGSTEATKRRGRYDRPEHPDFAEWWSHYPKKVARPEAAEAYAQAIERGASSGELLIGLRNHTFTPDRQYQPHPATWLRGERWKDEPGPRPRTMAEEDEMRHRAVLSAFPSSRARTPKHFSKKSIVMLSTGPTAWTFTTRLP